MLYFFNLQYGLFDNLTTNHHNRLSPVSYVNIEPQSWLGVEVIMRAVEALEYDIWDIMQPATQWVRFHSWYTRRAPAGGDKWDEIMKVYMKTDGILEQQTIRQFGWSRVFERIGSIWSVLGITVGLIGLKINAFKARFDKESRKTRERRFGEEHNIQAPQTAVALRELRKSIHDIADGDLKLEIAKLKRPQLSYLWSMPTVRTVKFAGAPKSRGVEQSKALLARQLNNWRFRDTSARNDGPQETVTCPNCHVRVTLGDGDPLECPMCGFKDPNHRVAVVQSWSLTRLPALRCESTTGSIKSAAGGEAKKTQDDEEDPPPPAVSLRVASSEELRITDKHLAVTKKEWIKHLKGSEESWGKLQRLPGAVPSPRSKNHEDEPTKPHDIMLRSLSSVASEMDTTDIVFSFDMTGSMSRAALSVRKNIEASVDKLFESAPGSEYLVCVSLSHTPSPSTPSIPGTSPSIVLPNCIYPQYASAWLLTATTLTRAKGIAPEVAWAGPTCFVRSTLAAQRPRSRPSSTAASKQAVGPLRSATSWCSATRKT